MAVGEGMRGFRIVTRAPGSAPSPSLGLRPSLDLSPEGRGDRGDAFTQSHPKARAACNKRSNALISISRISDVMCPSVQCPQMNAGTTARAGSSIIAPSRCQPETSRFSFG